MESSPLQSRKLGFRSPRPMNPFTRFTWLWDSSQPYFAHRSELPIASKRRPMHDAWNAVRSVDTTVHEHAHIYSLAHDAYWANHQAYPKGLDLPPLVPHDLHVATLVLGSDKVGQHNKQQSRIWGFGQKSEDDGMTVSNCFPSCHIVVLTCMSVDFVLKLNLHTGWRSKIAFIMRLNGSQLTFIPRQRHGGI